MVYDINIIRRYLMDQEYEQFEKLLKLPKSKKIAENIEKTVTKNIEKKLIRKNGRLKNKDCDDLTDFYFNFKSCMERTDKITQMAKSIITVMYFSQDVLEEQIKLLKLNYIQTGVNEESIKDLNCCMNSNLKYFTINDRVIYKFRNEIAEKPTLSDVDETEFVSVTKKLFPSSEKYISFRKGLINAATNIYSCKAEVLQRNAGLRSEQNKEITIYLEESVDNLTNYFSRLEEEKLREDLELMYC